MRILVIEDEPRMAGMIARGLRESSYAVDVAATGEVGLFQSSINRYDLVILDVVLPILSGLEVCRRMRQDGLNVPILMLTPRASIDDRVAGLDSGADDYLTKPFEFKELLAPLRALSRRTSEVRPATLGVADPGPEYIRSFRIAWRATDKPYRQGIRAPRVLHDQVEHSADPRSNIRTCVG